MRLGWILAVTLLPTSVHAASMAEAAKREKERREKNQNNGVVARSYGDEELARSTGELAAPAEKPSEHTPQTANPLEIAKEDPAAAEVDSERKLNEANWRREAAVMRAKVAHAEKAYEKAYEKAKNGCCLDGPVPLALRNAVQLEMDAATLRSLATKAKAALDAAKKDQADFEERARRAGALPGWLR